VTEQSGSFDGDPAFSPDGKTIAYSSGDADSGSLQTVPAAGGTPTTLLTSPSPPVTPVWSPDGTQIAYIDGNSLKTIAAAGGTPVVLVKALPGRSCAGSGLSWSPDGKQIAVGGARGISLVTLGAPATVRLAIADHCAEYPSFSPDGKQVAFDAPPAHALGGQTAIMVAGTDGAGLRTLSTEPFRQSVRPAWQPT
jgi:TolB protein